ncbi:hypothetical protein AB0B85_03385 [Micromonospora sp. NPDC049044]|uniref:hypothetical protein n=1 Tax=unclassified Micromonospora TaxID=2617518 RepID=UPI003410BED1
MVNRDRGPEPDERCFPQRRDGVAVASGVRDHRYRLSPEEGAEFARQARQLRDADDLELPGADNTVDVDRRGEGRGR